MNMSQLLTRIKVNLGLYSIALPFENADEAMIDVIQNITLRDFSGYCPYKEDFIFNVHDLQCLFKHANFEVYLLPDIFSQRELLYVIDARYDESDISGIGYWGGGVPLLHGNMLNQALLSNAGLALTNKMIPKLTFEYEHPRKIKFYNLLASCKVVLKLALMHDKNLTTISPTLEESFFKLACLDVKNMLYQTLKSYNDINSAYGNINLKIEEWQNAESERKELLNDWDQLYHMDIIPMVYA